VVFTDHEDILRRILSQEAPKKVAHDPLEGKKSNPDKKRKIESELLETERNFVRLLEVMEEKYYRDLQVNASSPTAFITQDEVKCIFFGLEKILDVNRPFLRDLELVLNPPKAPKPAFSRADEGQEVLTSVEQVILKHVQSFEQYTPYVNNYDASTRVLQALHEKSGPFRNFVVSSRLLPGCDRMDLFDLLITPIQRIPRYVLLLKDILRNITFEDPLFEDLKKATMKMAKMASYIDETKSKTEGRIKLLHLSKVIVDCPVKLISFPPPPPLTSSPHIPAPKLHTHFSNFRPFCCQETAGTWRTST